MDSKNNDRSGKATVGYTNPGEGMQGVDKAPGEESASSPDNFVKDAQKGKNKVDGDPEKESDQPANI